MKPPRSLALASILCAFALAPAAQAQSLAKPKLAPLPPLPAEQLLPLHLEHQRREIAQYARVTLAVPETLAAPFSIVVPWDGVDHQLTLALHDVRAPGYRLIAVGDGGVQTDYDPGEIRTFRGTVEDDKSAVVVGTLLASGMQAVVLLEDGRHIEIQPDFDAFVAGDRSSFLVFDSARATPCCEVTCGVTESMRLSPVLLPPSQGWTPACAGDLCLAEIAFDCDFPFYQVWGSSTSLSQDIAAHTLNVANVQYERELRIRHRLTATLVRTSAGSEPAGYASAANTNQLLDAFRAHWQASQGGIARDIGHLLTGRFGGAGLAWVGVVCNDPGFSYGLSSCAFNLIGGTNGLTCLANVLAHELGHNWGANHCTCASPAYTMNPSYRPCPLRFGPTSRGEIDAHRDANNGCLGDSVYNDDCAYALEVCPGNSYFDSNSSSTTDGSSGCGFGGNLGFNDVWYFYRPAASGTLTATTCNASTNFDTIVSIHTACPGTSANQIGCDDDTCGAPALASTATAPVTAGETYWIRVCGYAGATGNFVLNVTGPACRAPINDAQANAMDAGPGQYYANTSGATNDGTGSCGASATSPDVWYRYTPYNSEVVTLATFGSLYDTVLTVFNATGTTELFCNDDAGSPYFTLQSFLEFTPTPGATYLIRVSGYSGASGPLKLDISGPDSANSLCTGALTIPVGTRYGSFEGVFASEGASTCPNDQEPDLYYRYTATSAGTLVVSTCGTHDMDGVNTGPDTVLSLHSACDATAGNQLACNDDNFGTACGALDASTQRDSWVSASVTSGQVVRIRVSRFSSFQGRKPFRLNLELRPANDNCAAATNIGNGTFAGTLVGATNDGTASCGAAATAPDVWYRYTAACTGLLNVTTCGTHDTGGVDAGVDTVLSVHSACGGADSLCNDDSFLCGTLDTGIRRDSNLQVPVTSGQVVLIRVTAFGGGTPGPFTLRTSCAAYVATCIGDGALVGCPCGNNASLGTIGGCLNSFTQSSRLIAVGLPDLSADTLVLQGSLMGATAPCTYFQGTAQSFAFFGDGIRCVGGTVVRLKTVTNSGGASQYPQAGDPSVSVRGLVGSPGTRYYGGWYRNSAAFCTASTFNLTNGIQVYWHP